MVGNMLDFEETELRLGLPGGGGEKSNFTNNGKRLFEETTSSTVVDLKLNLSTMLKEKAANELDDLKYSKEKINSATNLISTVTTNSKNVINDDAVVKPPAKAQVVGWPPVRSFRKSAMTPVQKKMSIHEPEDHTDNKICRFVKVSMDGAPYLRKVDLKMYNTYQQLYDALGKMFSSFTIGKCEDTEGMMDFMNESKLMDLLNGSDYVPTYEDKDGDWMLVGDVPWEMFIQSCKRLRIMKGTEAKGLAPRAMEKCKSRT